MGKHHLAHIERLVLFFLLKKFLSQEQSLNCAGEVIEKDCDGALLQILKALDADMEELAVA